MKISLTLSVIILAVGFWLGATQHHKLSDLRSNHQKSLSIAEKMGVSTDFVDQKAGDKEPRRPRDQTTVDLKALISKFTALAKELVTSEDDPRLEKRTAELIKQIGRLGQGDLSKVLKTLWEDESLTLESRRNLIADTLMVLSANKPATAVALFAESSKSLEFDDITNLSFPRHWQVGQNSIPSRPWIG
ncbi:MAG: hypothetical protein HC845_01140 [Akkermansiaceae bacterium]|nr:hypothetical protein [Akkermansiaceae bacterium]